MDDAHKLAHLVEHWIEHNEEHARTYRDWAGKMAQANRTELSEALEEIARGTEAMDEAFRRVERLLKG